MERVMRLEQVLVVLSMFCVSGCDSPLDHVTGVIIAQDTQKPLKNIRVCGCLYLCTGCVDEKLKREGWTVYSDDNGRESITGVV